MRIFYFPLLALLILAAYGIPVLAAHHALMTHATQESAATLDMPFIGSVGTDISNLPPIAPPSSIDPVMFSNLGNQLSASGMLILDLQSGQILSEKSMLQSLPMASLTKLMTALIIVENHALDEMVIISQNAVDTEGSTAYLPLGESFSVGDLLSALLVASANDAAVALAEYHSGSEAAFVREMNERAKVLGLQKTSFMNATGFDHLSQYASPQDIGWLALSVLNQPALRKRLSQMDVSISGSQGTTLTLDSTHLLLRQETSVIAGKTGTTPEAKECLLSLIMENGKEYIVILQKSDSRYADMRTILNAFSPSLESDFSTL